MNDLDTDLARVDTDELRGSLDGMRDVVRHLAEEHAAVWTAPFPDFAEALTALGRVDLCLARLVEGHADALRILQQAGEEAHPGVYAVWASRSAGTGVAALPSRPGWQLDGELRFASGIDVVDRALLPGWVDSDTHLLFDLPVAGVEADRSTWRTSAMDAARSFTVGVHQRCDSSSVVGQANFYLDRPGFLVGGLGVAAVWAGGAQSLLDQVTAGLRRFVPTAHQLRRLGLVEQFVWTARTAVEVTARRLPDLDAAGVARETTLARTAVVAACEQAGIETERIVGPGGLSGEARLARTLADLALFVRQHHVDG
ncbi:MAG: hypothetical protein ABIQ59_04320, partial [Nocardioidaceae bacterium]